MAELRIGHKVFFDRGIESIVGTPVGVDELYLPDTHDLAPAALARATALDELLAATNLESLLEASVRPDLAERDLLSPQRFRAVMDAVLARFARVADARRHANPRLARLLDGAHRVLADETELRELLRVYRTALLQG